MAPTTAVVPKSFVSGRQDMERLVGWMVENQETLRGRKSAWANNCKEQVFRNHLGVTIERIGFKYNNLKASSWTATRKKIGGSGSWEAEDGELDEKYPFYQKLDMIFGTPPNANQEKTQAASRCQGILPASALITLQDTVNFGTLPPAEDPVVELEPETPPPKTQTIRSSSAAQMVLPGTSGQGKGLDRIDSVKRIMEERHSYEFDRELKRMKIEREMQRERLEAKERLARISASTAVEVARIQAEAQVRQFELLAQILTQRGGVNGGANGGMNGGAKEGANGGVNGE
ncbi:hypothetical protein BGX38DRAFT_1272764 [Terfezia claveryi]|nr:hypothetical protein BGX38DRAFT_1272764 [Terfezia claveryi]